MPTVPDITKPAVPTASLPVLVETLLRDQQEFTAVEQFAQRHADADVPTQARYYQSLLPASPPGPEEQYGFDVDLDRCSGCQACVTACHSLNGLDTEETWREVGLLHSSSTHTSLRQHVTTACHHCVEPGCMTACPTLAYEKNPVTGIVKHLDDQCFGCQYCILACPYEVPKYHPGKGIVRKCDMCQTRLSAGEAPACVQACPHEAIRITVVSTTEARTRAVRGEFLPVSPHPQHTIPTTRYHTTRTFPEDLQSADDHREHPEHTHWPLIVMLVISQVSVGLMTGSMIQRFLGSEPRGLELAGYLTGVLSVVAATLHLGRPWLAYRAILGWRTSGLSREIIAFGAYLQAASAVVVSPWMPFSAAALTGLSALAAVIGWLGVFCSVKIYAVTPRPYWAFSATATRFLGTTALFSFGFSLWGLSGHSLAAPCIQWAVPAMSLVAIGKLTVESRQRQAISGDRLRTQSARLLHGQLLTLWMVRAGLLLLWGVVAPAILFVAVEQTRATVLGTLLSGCLIAEFCERVLFFRAAAAPRMPGRMSP